MDENFLQPSADTCLNESIKHTSNNQSGRSNYVTERDGTESDDIEELWKSIELDIPGAAETSEVAEVPNTPSTNFLNKNKRVSKKRITRKANSEAGKTSRQSSLKLSQVVKDASQLPLAALVPPGELPLDHRPARGRGRCSQLKKMTPEQREAEAVARAERNRLAARDFRLRQRYYEKELEDKVETLQESDRRQAERIHQLEAEVVHLRSLLELPTLDDM